MNIVLRVFAIVPSEFLENFQKRGNGLLNSEEGEKIKRLLAIDGKTQRGNGQKNLHYFDKEALFAELETVNTWYDRTEFLHDLTIDYRIKSMQSAYLKYSRYYPDHQTGKVFNDMLGFRTLCDDYADVVNLGSLKHIRVADMSKGKANNDGYRGVHIYFQLDNFHYPIEIQYNTYYDRQLNNWLHKYVYKKGYDNDIGCFLRTTYENGIIKTEQEFKGGVLHSVLLDSKKG